MRRMAVGIPARVRELLADATFEAIAIVEGTSITWCNRAFEEMFQITREDVIGRSPLELAAPEDHERILDAIRTGSPEPYEATGVRPDGSRFVGELRGRQIEVDGQTYRLTAIRDITDRRAMEESLRRSEARYRDLFDKAGDGLLVMDRDAMPRQVNARLCEMLGRTREEILSMSPDQAIVNIERRPMQLDRLAEVDGYLVERQLRHADGTPIDVEVNITSTGDDEILAVIRDLRERKRAARQQAALRDRLQQAQSLEALGRLAGGVAHDFNNLLTVILAAADTLVRRGVEPPQVTEIRVAAERATELTSKLLTFSRAGPQHVRRLDVGAQLEALSPLLRRLLGPAHELRLEVVDGPVYLLADASQVTQVVMNLALNARDATPGGGPIDIRVQPDGDRLRLSVRDRGPGIPDEVRTRLFEPFFTTKDRGGNVGLGLSIVYGVVTGLGGQIEVDSGAEGTCFTITLPRSASGESDHPPTHDAPRRSLHILVVEDHDAVRRTVVDMLEVAGHRVSEASGCTEAIAWLERGEPFDVMLSDVVMPDGSGVTLADRVGPERTLLMSGYPRSELSARDDLRLLSKPFTLTALLDAIAEIAS